LNSREETPMPRISLPAPETMTPDQRKVYDKIVTGKRGRIQGPLRAALHNPDLAERWSALGELLRYGTTLTPRQSELAILITGRLCRSPFEWYAHRPEAEKAGLPADVIDAIFAGATPTTMSAEDSAVYHYTLELNRYRSVSDKTYARALELFGERTVVELTALVGYYTMVAMTLNSHEIPFPEGVTPPFKLPQQEELE
jgi:4-carboxymuconolactone decarboxylase